MNQAERLINQGIIELQERVKVLENALRPFAAIANEYDKDGLDEVRPDWVNRGVARFDPKAELYAGRGGKQLITLEDVLNARDALTGKAHARPDIDPVIAKVRRLYEASIPNLPWEQMSEDRRNTIIENYRREMSDESAHRR